MTPGGYYAVDVRHDKGETRIYNYAMDAESAKRVIMSIEGCPERSVLRVQRKAPHDQMQPELAQQVYDLDYFVWLRIDEAGYCYESRSSYDNEEHGCFDTKTEAAEALIRSKA